MTIHVQEGTSTQFIDTYQAEVRVYNKATDRSLSPMEEVDQYRLSVGNVGGKLITRIDYAAKGSIPARTVITNEKESILFNTADGNILQRMPIETGNMFSTKVSNLTGITGRVDVSLLRAELKRLNFDFTEDKNSTILVVGAPRSYLSRISSSERTPQSFKLFYDTSSETFAGSELIYVDQAGVTITQNTQPVYQQAEDGQLFKVGEVTTIRNDFPHLLVDSGILPGVSTINEIPLVTPADLEKMEAEGSIITDATPVIGDTKDPDYTQTQVQVYENIQINTLSEELFRIPGVQE